MNRKATPGGLASKLASAQEKRDAKVSAAEAALAKTRADVIATGTDQIHRIQALRAELDAEQLLLEDAVAQAKA